MRLTHEETIRRIVSELWEEVEKADPEKDQREILYLKLLTTYRAGFNAGVYKGRKEK